MIEGLMVISPDNTLVFANRAVEEILGDSGENLEGKAEFRFFSTNGSARFWEVWKWPFAVRYTRLLTPIH